MKITRQPPTVARSRPIVRRSAVLVLLGAFLLAGGCAKKYRRPPKPVADHGSAAAPATQPVREFNTFFAEIDPPADWRFELTSQSDRHEHVTWISPGDNTACGIIHFRMPFPVGHELAFRYGFLAEMRRKEGVAKLIEKHWDPQIEGLRFVVESKFFHVEAKFFVRGMEGWAIYAGTRLGYPVNDAEFETARQVRERAEFVESK